MQNRCRGNRFPHCASWFAITALVASILGNTPCLAATRIQKDGSTTATDTTYDDSDNQNSRTCPSTLTSVAWIEPLQGPNPLDQGFSIDSATLNPSTVCSLTTESDWSKADCNPFTKSAAPALSSSTSNTTENVSLVILALDHPLTRIRAELLDRFPREAAEEPVVNEPSAWQGIARRLTGWFYDKNDYRRQDQQGEDESDMLFQPRQDADDNIDTSDNEPEEPVFQGAKHPGKPLSPSKAAFTAHQEKYFWGVRKKMLKLRERNPQSYERMLGVIAPRLKEYVLTGKMPDFSTLKFSSRSKGQNHNAGPQKPPEDLIEEYSEELEDEYVLNQEDGGGVINGNQDSRFEVPEGFMLTDDGLIIRNTNFHSFSYADHPEKMLNLPARRLLTHDHDTVSKYIVRTGNTLTYLLAGPDSILQREPLSDSQLLHYAKLRLDQFCSVWLKDQQEASSAALSNKLAEQFPGISSADITAVTSLINAVEHTTGSMLYSGVPARVSASVDSEIEAANLMDIELYSYICQKLQRTDGVSDVTCPQIAR